VGPASRADSQIGPMINARAVEKIERHVADALARGAKVLTGGHSLRNDVADGPHYYAPTVLVDVTAGAALLEEETFGPVVPLIRFGDEMEVLRQANDTPTAWRLISIRTTSRASGASPNGSRSGSSVSTKGHSPARPPPSEE